MKKRAIFTIEETILQEFKKLSKSQAINMSQFVENKMQEEITKHGNINKQ